MLFLKPPAQIQGKGGHVCQFELFFIKNYAHTKVPWVSMLTELAEKHSEKGPVEARPVQRCSRCSVATAACSCHGQHKRLNSLSLPNAPCLEKEAGLATWLVATGAGGSWFCRANRLLIHYSSRRLGFGTVWSGRQCLLRESPLEKTQGLEKSNPMDQVTSLSKPMQAK